MNKYQHRGGVQSLTSTPFNLQIFANDTTWVKVENPYTINPIKRNYLARADNSENKIVKTFTIDYPVDLPYNGKEQKYIPKISDEEGKLYYEGDNDGYIVTITYDTDDFRNVTGTINVSISITSTPPYYIYDTDSGYETIGIVEKRTYQITPRELEINPRNDTKVAGELDKDIQFSVNGLLEGEYLRIDGQFTRGIGEAVGSYDIQSYNLVPKIDEYRSFDPKNYNIHYNLGTFTIFPAGVTGEPSLTPGTNPDCGTIPYLIIKVLGANTYFDINIENSDTKEIYYTIKNLTITNNAYRIEKPASISDDDRVRISMQIPITKNDTGECPWKLIRNDTEIVTVRTNVYVFAASLNAGTNRLLLRYLI